MNRPDSDGPIVIIRRLAVGGMSEVFLGQQALPDGRTRAVVVKRLLPGAGDQGRTLLRREREALAALDSPFVVRLLGGSDDEIVLEYVDGPDLASLLAHLSRRGRVLPVPAALAVIEGILLGLRDLHAARGPDGAPLGLVHRDLSPGNVLVSRAGAVKLTDLGVVHRDVAGDPTLPGFKGTLAYMAPEQLRGEGVDPRTDLYAAGLIAYEVLTGVPARPAGLQGLAELLDARSRLPAPPSVVRPGLPEGLDAPVLRSLEPDRTRRFASAAEMWKAFRAGAGASPDSSCLAGAAREVAESPSRSERTLGPDEPPQRPVRTPPSSAPRKADRVGAGGWARRIGLVAPPVVLGVGVAVAWLAGWIGAPVPPSPDPGLPATDAAPIPDNPVPVPEVSGPDRPDGTLVGQQDSDQDLAPHAPRRPEPPAPGRASRRGERGRGRPIEEVPATLVVAPAGAGAVHVSGSGVRGLAPVRMPLADRQPVVLTLRAGASALPVRLRVQPGPGGPVAFVGAPEGRYYQVSCGGADPGPSPVGPVRVGARLRCEVAAPDGTSAAFELRVERE